MMREEVLSASEFWRGWEQLREDDRFGIVTEPDQLESVWREVTTEFPRARCAETDSYFAAFARCGGWTLVTFDRGFKRFPELQKEILS